MRRETGGTNTEVTINQPNSIRRGLLTDSESTTTYTLSLVRIGGDVIKTTHDPKRGRRVDKEARDCPCKSNTDNHHEKPLCVGYRYADQALSSRPVLLFGMQLVEGRIQHFIQDIVATCDQGCRNKAD